MTTADDAAGSRRFGEKELALILRRAAELQAREGSAPARSGMTLGEIESVAAEAGIDARHVRAAVLGLGDDRPSPLRRIVGPRAHIDQRRALSWEPGPQTLAAIVEAAQAATGRPGTARDVLGGIEWYARDSTGRLLVTARPRGGETLIHVSTDRSEAAAFIATLFPIGTIAFGAPLAALLLPIPGLVAVGASALAGLAAARVVWARTAARWHERVTEIAERVVQAAEAARPDGAAP